MSDIVLVAQVCMFNEVKKGNLDRCLDNLSRYCDHIVAYDDASTDNSVEIAGRYRAHVIQGQVNNQMQELAHKQMILEKSLELGATHLFWLDCDEVLDRKGTLSGLRRLCENWPEDIDAFSFPEINLWRSQTWQRIDSLFTVARFVRLWKVQSGISFKVQDGVHKQLYPHTIREIREAPFSVIHYGFCNYKEMLVKIGAPQMNQEELQSCAEFGIDRQAPNWLLDERRCLCQKLDDSVYPPGTLPPDVWREPQARAISELEPFPELPDEPELPLMDSRALASWTRLHQSGYHGDYQHIHERNKGIWGRRQFDPENRTCLFKFNPADKIVFDVACGGGWFMLDCLINGAKKVYGFEINSELIRQAQESFKELGVPESCYEFIDLSQSLPELPEADVIYSVALFMHIPFWQALRYFRWIYKSLAPDGEAHLQFYQKPGEKWTMFWDGFAGSVPGGDRVTTIRLHNELERIGFNIESTHMAEGKGVLPLWQMYKCVKGDIK
jgi:SAM-dependent methyltransferase